MHRYLPKQQLHGTLSGLATKKLMGRAFEPGYLRVKSVHQGDQDRVKGVYHINAVDCVTQYEGVATCERIREAFLIPVLETLLQSFPFAILGFHSDNGSEFINHQVVNCSTSCSLKRGMKANQSGPEV